MNRLAVCGWDEQIAALVRAISLRSDLEAVAIGDDRPAALVRARAATGLPCYQHLREMLRAIDYDTVLIGDTADREALVDLAADRGAAIILRGSVAGAGVLRAASDAVARGAAGLRIARPELQHAGMDLLASLATGDPDWTPRLLQIEINDAGGLEAALDSATALVARLQPEPATQVVAATLRGPTDRPLTASIQIRHAEEAISAVTVQDHRDEWWRVSVQAHAGTAELINRDGASTLTIEPAEGVPEQSDLVDDDLLDLEARRLADPASRRMDERLALPEAALLTAIDSSINTGFVTPVHELGARGNLRVLEGGRLTTSRREGHLRLLGN